MRQDGAGSAKAAAVRQWTADPCGPETQTEPGTAAYAEELVVGRREYAPWFAEALDYRGAAALKVLDVGCGQGIDLIEYARAGAEVTGVDLTPRHVDLARRNVAALGLRAEIVEADAENLPFADETFDRVSSNGVLHHTPDIEAALAEVRRVLKRGGEARILVYNRLSFHYWLNQVLLEGIGRRHLLRERSMAGVLSLRVERTSIDARPLVRVYSPRQVRKLMVHAGFADVATSVGGFNIDDTWITGLLSHRFTRLRDPTLLARLGRLGGWYVLGYGRRP